MGTLVNFCRSHPWFSASLSATGAVNAEDVLPCSKLKRLSTLVQGKPVI